MQVFIKDVSFVINYLQTTRCAIETLKIGVTAYVDMQIFAKYVI
jgi:hypothetical protein